MSPKRKLYVRPKSSVVALCVAVASLAGTSAAFASAPPAPTMAPRVEDVTPQSSDRGPAPSTDEGSRAITRSNTDTEIPATLATPVLGRLLRGIELANSSHEEPGGDRWSPGYDEPGHFDVEWFVDEVTGESYWLRSGVTHWEETDSSGVSSRSARAVSAYSDVFTVTGPTIVPGGQINSAAQSTLHIEMDIPSTASAGDQYTLALKAPLYWISGSIKDREIKDASGKVFAVVGPGVEWPNNSGAFESMVITLTDAVDEHTAIQGFVDVRFYSASTKTVQNVVVDVFAPDGSALGPAIPAKTNQAVGGNGFSHSNGALIGNQPALTTAVNVAEADMRFPFVFTVAPLTAGATSKGCEFASVMYQGFDSRGFWSTKGLVVPNLQCVLNADGSMKVTLPTKPSNTTGLSGGQYRVAVQYMADEPGKTYQVKMTTNIPSSASPTLAAGWSGPIVSGVPVGAGADHLSLTTKKTASFTTQNGDAKPTVGDTITYTITTSPAETNDRAIKNLVTLDRLPEGLEFVSATGGGEYNSTSREIVWGPRTLTSTGVFTDTVTAKITSIPATGDIANTVENVGEEVCTEDDTVSVCDSTVTTPVGKPGFAFTKSSTLEDTNGNGWLGDKGDTIVYTFTVKNTGETTLTTAKLTDDLLGIKDVECLAEGTSVKPGASATCEGTFTHVISEADVEAGQVTNHATLCVDPAYGLACEPGETTEKVIDPSFAFDKSVVEIKDASGKVVTTGKASEGDVIHFGFSAENTGDVDITSLLVTDPMLGVEDIQCLSEGFVLEVGKSVDCVDNAGYLYTVTAADVKAGKVHNIATGQVPGLPEQPGETTTPVIPGPVVTELPKTGAGGTWLLVGAGSLMLLGGAYALIRSRRKVGDSHEMAA